MRNEQVGNEWRQPLAGFSAVCFERTDPAANARRFDRVSWEPTLFDEGAVVRAFGRRWWWKRVLITPFPSFDTAWPFICAVIKTRLRHKYRIVEMDRLLPEPYAQ